MRGPTKDQFIDYKAMAIRYRGWASTWFAIAAGEFALILTLIVTHYS